MNNDELTKVAVAAGFKVFGDKIVAADDGVSGRATDSLRRFADLVAAAEQERCLNCYSPDDTATDWADKIRALPK